MSGGHFDYIQYQFQQVADSIDSEIDKNGKPAQYELQDFFPEDVIERFKLAAELSRVVGKLVHEVDYRISCDTGDDTFTKRFDDAVAEGQKSISAITSSQEPKRYFTGPL